ncbi:NAD+ synthetase [Ehrlichia chaffeensis str. Heartland]|uniref:Glutamine-dependent NAD(+) synthetase n=1 Tax=Ehrlichia chaffeensis (strain ATCC CRL-10679 / Arkansas) TaxID=205920 RepID=Q2GG15_EHRCR|nr:NAD(+) synthase [Ehrlichia chaffeensis]ABD45480.1 glutamine-dependent NAD(+) synthetase [Ehrlichia chaffeensis str. Arkansas]AHX03875.1 NAD+ synthetase [Ehrlichia chaffeensis str. Heartland]AHX05399.1 NAD+ synthetase [Ehrlichia chaffeensis str. Jax]AHX06386.1 NAD+ synthetase [Ehrlichia chaffeensis str. Liberty]AHX07388.1 NAD+ synthetase [Ehrlichia chaffeensis str. Osceola]
MYNSSIFISQLNYNPENIDYNYDSITKSYQESVYQAADIAIFSRYAVSGHIQKIPTLHKNFFNQCTNIINKLALQTNNKNTAIIIGSIKKKNNVIFETIYLIKNGEITELIEFPTDSQSSDISATFTINNINVLLLPISKIPKLPIHNNDTLLLIMDNTQYTKNTNSRDDLISKLTFNKYAVYINQIGGYNNLVFHGKSFFTFNGQYNFLNMWQEDSKVCKADLAKQDNHTITSNSIESDYQALMLALRDYIYKNAMTSVIMGLSGGIDSALVASIAADALGPNNVHSLMLPTKYTSQMSITDSKECAMRLGISYNILSIEEIFQTSLAALQNTFIDTQEDITEENLQARIRGNILMALSNKFKFMLLSTGNKSELFVGYATLYGDMCGGFAPIKDIYKTRVYELSKWRNKNIPVNSLCKKIDVIPSQIIEKHPSAELRYNQKDQDTLPDYAILDSILTLLIDQNHSTEDIIKKGYNIQDVNYIIHLIQKSQFKREQASTGPLIN